MKKLLQMLVAAVPLFASAAEQNIYHSQMLGFTVEKPDAWTFLSANTYLEQTKQLKLNDPEMQKNLQESLRAPLVVITKQPPDNDDVNTSFKADAKPFGQLPPGTSGVEIIKLLLPVLRANFTGFDIVTGPVEVTVSGKKAGYIKMHYLNVTAAGQHPSASEMWIVPRKDYFFILGGAYSRQATAAPGELAQIVSKVKID